MNAPPTATHHWRKILQTPVSHLLRGRFTGPQSPLEQLDTASLPAGVREAIRAITAQLSGRRQSNAARQLVKSCNALLREGCPETQLVEQLSEPESIASLIQVTGNTDWVLQTPLPARLWPTVNALVGQKHVRKTAARKMLSRVCRSLQWQLKAGRTPETLIETSGEAIALGGLLYETKSLAPLLDFRLPERLVSVVLDVVRRTRLWPEEKLDTARELCAHFADGLEQGETEETLIESFGSPQTAARLIRRACLRNRPFAWRVRRRTWQTIALLMIAILVPWTVVTVRFLVAQPTITFDLIEEVDDLSRAIPRQERAWPLYLQGLTKLKVEKFQKYDLANGTASEHWPEAKTFLNQHPEELESILEAAKRPQLGFIYRPLANDLGEYRELNRPYEGNTADRQQTNLNILLPQLQDLGFYVLPFLRAASFLAAEQDDGEKCYQIFLARLAVAEHIRQVIDCPITYIVYNAKTRLIAQDLQDLVQQQPALFTTSQLTTLFRKLSATQDKSVSMKQVKRIFISDFLQKAYTNEGDGNGRFTANGFRILCDLANFSEEKQDLLKSLFLVSSHTENRSIQSTQDPQHKFLAAPVAAMIADRKTTQDKFHELFQLLWSEQSTGISNNEPAESLYLDAYRSLLESPANRIRYLPVLLLMPDKTSSLVYLQQAKHSVQQEIALTLVAAELYRREHGQYPSSLQDLVPEYFSGIPEDPQTGKPLRYQIKDGRSVVDHPEAVRQTTD